MTLHALTRRGALLRGASAVLAGSVAGCLSGSQANGEPTVTMTDDLRFDPESIEVTAGTTIVWENPSRANHTVTATEIPTDAHYFASGGFFSEQKARDDSNGGLIKPGGSYSHTVRVPGSYEYVCLPHEQSGMTGTVTVTDTDKRG